MSCVTYDSCVNTKEMLKFEGFKRSCVNSLHIVEVCVAFWRTKMFNEF
jgi:hypothetical protein